MIAGFFSDPTSLLWRFHTPNEVSLVGKIQVPLVLLSRLEHFSLFSDAFAGPVVDGVVALPVVEGVSHWETSSMHLGESGLM